MNREAYQLRSQLGAGRDGAAFRAISPDGTTTLLVLDLARARADAARWAKLAPRLRLAATLTHPSALSIIELHLDDEAARAILEWPGETTLATAERSRLPASQRATANLLKPLAAALAESHGLGLAHGCVGPEHVFLCPSGSVKLEFTGARTGFPQAPQFEAVQNAPESIDEMNSPAALRAADLFGLGALIGWLDRKADEARRTHAHRVTRPDDSPLENIARALMAEDPAERPSAQEVLVRLDELTRPVDATDIWNKPEDRSGPNATMVLPAADRPALAARSRARPPMVDQTIEYLGRYRVLEKLGEGGQGVVYRALDPMSGSVVAIKVLRADRVGNEVVLRRFRKEARMMIEANNPHVVNVLDQNEHAGIPYLVLEFVAGTNLAQVLEQKSRLEVHEALRVMAGVARGLSQPHDRGIIHRDIKPGNILLLDQIDGGAMSLAETAQGGPSRAATTLVDSPKAGAKLQSRTESDAPTATLAEAANGDAAHPQIKITDFGLARHVIEAESLAMTDAGALLGTPHYMAPEQWTGRIVDPRTDVYAMGATLFHLLAGEPPFTGETRDVLCQQHCNEQPRSLALLNPSVSEGLARAVERALSKSPDNRYADAAAMLRDLEALRLGKPTDLAIHPRLPECDPSRILEFEFRWDLESSPRELWPLVTNTDRLDRAIGFLPVTYQTRFEPGRGVRTFAEGRKAGMREAGEEFPYEWVEPRRMGVLRQYTEGPFKWLVSSVELLPRSGGGTTLVHSLRLEPATWAMRLGSRWGVGVGMRKSLEKVYRRIDATLKRQREGGLSPAVDPFEDRTRMPAVQRERLDRLIDRLLERGLDAQVVDSLFEHLIAGSAQELARIRPLALAERFGLDPDQLVAACLHGAKEGLLELHWDLLCPVCRISAQVTDTLREIAEHAHCQACHLDFNLDFANSIEMIFRVHPEIREAELGTFCVGGPAHSPHVVAQMRVAPRERIELEMALAEGAYRLRGPQLPWMADFRVDKIAPARQWDIDLTTGPTADRPASLRAGSQTLSLHNRSECELLVRVERTAQRHDALTAARAASLPLFRELFPGEILAPGRLATVSSVTLLCTSLDPVNVDALYRELGDAGAFGVIHQHFQQVGDAIRQGGGAVVKTIGEGILASFAQVTEAVQTALSLVDRLSRSGATEAVGVRVGIHKGPAMAATVNDQLDYFGTTPRDAVAMLSEARNADLLLTEPVASDPAVAALLREHGIEPEIVPTTLAGHRHLIKVLRGGKRQDPHHIVR